MISLLTQFAESTSGIGALGIDGKAFIIQLVTFVLAIFVLKKWAVGPIVKMMQRRRETIEQGVSLGEKMKKQEAELEAKVGDTLRKAREEADKIIVEANESARDAIREAEDKAREKAEGILQEASERITTDTARARKKLEGELVDLIAGATEAIIHEKVDAQKDAQLIDNALKEQKA